MTDLETKIANTADRLAALYTQAFGGKDAGRYRITTKMVCQLADRRRLYEDDVRLLTREMLELGFVIIDMSTFFVVLSANTFVNYRRVNEGALR